ncbi:MAG: hypothetical protein H6544_02320 [Prevotellaceae bacterium]|nr:hypothetical protein [Prevotellaceae bacterium]
MKQIKIIILLIATCMLLCACPDKTEQDFIYITNKSDKTIAFQVNVNKQDEIFYCSDIGTTILISVKSNSTFKLDNGDTYSSWNSYLKSLTVFILDGELYEEYWQQPCDTIRKYVPILHTYRLTLEDLQRMNWTVVYPPEE